MHTLVNKTARVVNVDSLMLVPGVAQKVGDIEPLLSIYPGLKAMMKKGEIVEIEKVSMVEETSSAEEAATEEEEQKPKRRAVRKKE